MKLPLTADTPLNPKLKITSTAGLVEIKYIIETRNAVPNNYLVSVPVTLLVNFPGFDHWTLIQRGETVAEPSTIANTAADRPWSKQSSCAKSFHFPSICLFAIFACFEDLFWFSETGSHTALRYTSNLFSVSSWGWPWTPETPASASPQD